MARLQTGELLRGVMAPRETRRSVSSDPTERRNAANLRIGSRAQQTCECAAEKPGEVVRNHTVGTGRAARNRRDRSEGRKAFAGVDAADHVDGGVTAKPKRGRSGSTPTGGTSSALERSEAGEGRFRTRWRHRERHHDEIGQPSRVRQATGKTEEGAGKFTDPRRSRRMDLEEPANLTRANRSRGAPLTPKTSEGT